jgi:hypothetical protein
MNFLSYDVEDLHPAVAAVSNESFTLVTDAHLRWIVKLPFVPSPD